MIGALRVQCPDIDEETTTSEVTTEETTTEVSNQPPKCEIEDLEEFVCGLEEENQFLKNEVVNLQEENHQMREKLESHSAKLAELEEKILELILRP